MVGGIEACSDASVPLIASTVLITFAPGILNTTRKTLGLPLLQAAWVDRLADVAHPHRRPVAIGDDHIVPRLGVGQLVVILDGESLLGADERALGAIDGCNPDLRPHVLELHRLLDEFRRIDLDAYGRRLLAADPHKGDA